MNRNKNENPFKPHNPDLSLSTPNVIETPAFESNETQDVVQVNEAIFEGVDQIKSMLDSNKITEQVTEHEGFFKSRWQQVTQAISFGKRVVNTVRDKFSISVYGERLSVLENTSVRLYRATFIPAILDIKNGTDYGMDHPQNNLMAQLAYNRHKKQKSYEMSAGDWATFGAYELLTVPVVRAMGLIAIFGATKPFYNKNKESQIAKVHKATARRLERHETGEYNPVMRRKGRLERPSGAYHIEGYSRSDLKNLSKTDLSRRAPFKTDRLA